MHACTLIYTYTHTHTHAYTRTRQVQPAAYPACALASVTLMGELGEAVPDAGDKSQGEGSTMFSLAVEKCLYFGGMDQVRTADIQTRGNSAD